MTLDYHFKVEQEAGSSTFAFFGFNGMKGKSLGQNSVVRGNFLQDFFCNIFDFRNGWCLENFVHQGSRWLGGSNHSRRHGFSSQSRSQRMGIHLCRRC